MRHMDEYTILYQVKNYITSENDIKVLLEENVEVDTLDFLEDVEGHSEAVRALALRWLELGVKEMRYEYPPNVSKRMEKYYHHNKQYLAQVLTPHVKKVINEYKEHIHLNKISLVV